MLIQLLTQCNDHPKILLDENHDAREILTDACIGVFIGASVEDVEVSVAK
jgi:hypothetical protein